VEDTKQQFVWLEQKVCNHWLTTINQWTATCVHFQSHLNLVHAWCVRSFLVQAGQWELVDFFTGIKYFEEWSTCNLFMGALSHKSSQVHNWGKERTTVLLCSSLFVPSFTHSSHNHCLIGTKKENSYCGQSISVCISARRKEKHLSSQTPQQFT